MSERAPLPPGPYEADVFPRFGLTPFAKRFPKQIRDIVVEIGGDVEQTITVTHELAQLPRVHRTADFHCVTTCSHRALRWSGVRFADFYERIVVRDARPAPDATFVVLRGQDCARTSLPLSDLLDDSVLLADRLDHPRARVEFEERGRVVPGWLLRFLYRPLVRPTVNRFRRELERHLSNTARR